MKKIAISVGMAVITGVLLLSVNGAFGLTAPTQDPATANLVIPVFGGLDVQGEIKNNAASGDVVVNDTLDAKGTIKNTGGDVVIDDALDVKGSVKNSSGDFVLDDILDLKNILKNSAGALLFGDATVVQADVDADASNAALIIRQSAGATAWIGIDGNEIRAQGTPLYLNWDSGQDVIIGSGTDYSGNKTDVDIRGTVFNGSSGTVALKISDGLEITGFVSNPTGTDPVTINDNFEVVGGMVISGSLSNLVPGMAAGTTLPVKVDDDLHITGFISNPTGVEAVKFSDNLVVGGGIVLTGGIVAGDSITTTQSLNAYVNLSVGGNADFRGAVSNEDAKPLNLADDVAVAGTLAVTGKLTAGTLGTYTEVESGPVTLVDTNSDAVAGTVGHATAVCVAPAVIISCSGRISGTSSGAHDDTSMGNLSAAEVRFASRTCYVEGHTTSGYTRYLFAKTLCFNPGV